MLFRFNIAKIFFFFFVTFLTKSTEIDRNKMVKAWCYFYPKSQRTNRIEIEREKKNA
jgi:hypothetical protein